MRSVQSGFPMSLWVAGPFIKLSDFVSYVNLTNFVRFNLFMRWAGFVAQIVLRTCFPLPQTDLVYSLCSGYAKCSEAI